MDIETQDLNNIETNKLGYLPPSAFELSKDHFKELLEARTEIAELKGYCLDFPNPLLLLSPSIIKESLASSEIENIHTTIINVLQNSIIPEAERRTADKEVLRYREALMFGFKKVKELPLITANLIIGIQNKLMEVKNEKFRESQNAIVNHKTGEVIFVPPKSNELNGYVRNLEEYINSKSDQLEMDPIIRAAVAHYQFECIHPFSDGNGRTGRILMVLQMVKDGLLDYPILYLSGYIQKNKTEYYRLLKKVSDENSWEEFLLFMIRAFKIQAITTKMHLLETKMLFERTKQQLKKGLGSSYSHELIESIFISPIITPSLLAKKLDIHYTTASTYLKKMNSLGILEAHKFGKYNMYANKELIKLLNK